MLDDFCNSLSDEAQLKIALRLGKQTLPVWNKYFAKNPDALEKLNGLMEDSNRVKGAAKKIDLNFPKRALEKIERSYEDAKKKGGMPLPQMKSDGTLSPILATSMQPLTNSKWDDILPYTVRLVFTLTWNIVTWILLRRKTDANDTHIYIAINQAVDVLDTDNILSASQIESILKEYSNETRGKNEDSSWENAPKVQEEQYLEPDEITRKISGENIIKDACGRKLAKEILRQMRDEGKTYSDQYEEYLSGIIKEYFYNEKENCFYLSMADTVAGGFDQYPLSENEMLNRMSEMSLSDLRDSGFEI